MNASFSLTLIPCVAITDPPLPNTRKYLRSEPDCGNTSTRSASPFHWPYRFLIASIIETIIELNFIEIIFQPGAQIRVCPHQPVYRQYDHTPISCASLPDPDTHL